MTRSLKIFKLVYEPSGPDVERIVDGDHSRRRRPLPLRSIEADKIVLEVDALIEARKRALELHDGNVVARAFVCEAEVDATARFPQLDLSDVTPNATDKADRSDVVLLSTASASMLTMPA